MRKQKIICIYIYINRLKIKTLDKSFPRFQKVFGLNLYTVHVANVFHVLQSLRRIFDIHMG